MDRIGLSNKKITTHAYLLGKDPDTIEKNYQRLSALGLSDKKIAQKAGLLGWNPKTINMKFQRLIELLRSNYHNRDSGREIILRYPQLLQTSLQNVEANMQWFSEKGIDYNEGRLLLARPYTRRKKVAWILREVFDYNTLPSDQKRQTIKNMYSFVKNNPRVLASSIKSLEKNKGELLGKAIKYK